MADPDPGYVTRAFTFQVTTPDDYTTEYVLNELNDSLGDLRDGELAIGPVTLDATAESPPAFAVWMSAHPLLAGLNQVGETEREQMPPFLHAMASMLSQRKQLTGQQASKAALAWQAWQASGKRIREAAPRPQV
jgi:hypothetical protein